MRIINENNTEIVTYDEGNGYLQPDRILIKHHEAIEAVEEVGHYKVIKEYPNGGKDVEWVVDTPCVEAKEAWDEYEDVLRFVPFSQTELAQRRISELKRFLYETDYHVIKVMEGAITIADIADIVEQRAAWRKEINDLEKSINN